MVLIIWMTMYICALNFVFGCWVLSLIFVWQGLDNMLWVHRHRFWNLLCCIELSPCQVSQAGADYFLWRSWWMFYHLTTMLWWWECLAHLLLTSSSWAAFIASCCFTVWNLEVFSWQVPELSEFFLDCWLSDEYKRSELEQERIQRRQCQVNCDGYRIIG